jgi:hypothetical protein
MTVKNPSDTPTRWQNLADMAGYVTIILMAVLPPLLGLIGWDFVGAYRADTLVGSYGQVTFNPWPVYWLIYPFAVLPVRWGALLWNLVNAGGYLYALRRLGGQPLWFAVSLPCLWTFTEGQIEGFMALGLAVAMTLPPLWAGAGLVLLSLKPQIGLLAILFILYRRRDWRLFVVPLLVYSASLLYWGFWLDDWLNTLPGMNFANRANIENVSLYPYALLLLPLLFYARDLKIWLLLESLCFPYFALHSLAPAFTLPAGVTTPALVVVTWLIYLLKINQVLGLQVMGLVVLLALLWEVWLFSRKKRLPSSRRDAADGTPLPIE